LSGLGFPALRHAIILVFLVCWFSVYIANWQTTFFTIAALISRIGLRVGEGVSLLSSAIPYQVSVFVELLQGSNDVLGGPLHRCSNFILCHDTVADGGDDPGGRRRRLYFGESPGIRHFPRIGIKPDYRLRVDTLAMLE